MMLFSHAVLAQTDDERLSPGQRKQFEEVQGSLASFAQNPVQGSAVQEQMKKLFSTSNVPSEQSMNRLTSNLLTGLSNGQVTVKEAQVLSREVTAFLNFQHKSAAEFNAAYKRIQELVESTRLGADEKNRLLHDLYAVVTTAQQYHQLQRGLDAVAGGNGQKQEAVRDQLGKMLTRSLAPTNQSINELAAGLAASVNNGLTVEEALKIATDLSNLLDTKAVALPDFKNIERTVKQIEAQVQQSKLGILDRNLLYNQILTVISTANPKP
jgi:hypothetical protein